MMEWTHFANHDGWWVLDEEKKQGNFIFYYTPSGKVVIFDVWVNKHGDKQMAYNKRKNCNANILPSIAPEVIEAIGKVAGVTTEATSVQDVAQVDKRGVGQVDIKKDIKNLGV